MDKLNVWLLQLKVRMKIEHRETAKEMCNQKVANRFFVEHTKRNECMENDGKALEYQMVAHEKPKAITKWIFLH